VAVGAAIRGFTLFPTRQSRRSERIRVLAERRLTDARSPVPDRQEVFVRRKTAEAMAERGAPAPGGA